MCKISSLLSDSIDSMGPSILLETARRLRTQPGIHSAGRSPWCCLTRQPGIPTPLRLNVKPDLCISSSTFSFLLTKKRAHTKVPLFHVLQSSSWCRRCKSIMVFTSANAFGTSDGMLLFAGILWRSGKICMGELKRDVTIVTTYQHRWSYQARESRYVNVLILNIEGQSATLSSRFRWLSMSCLIAPRWYQGYAFVPKLIAPFLNGSPTGSVAREFIRLWPFSPSFCLEICKKCSKNNEAEWCEECGKSYWFSSTFIVSLF